MRLPGNQLKPPRMEKDVSRTAPQTGRPPHRLIFPSGPARAPRPGLKLKWMTYRLPRGSRRIAWAVGAVLFLLILLLWPHARSPLQVTVVQPSTLARSQVRPHAPRRAAVLRPAPPAPELYFSEPAVALREAPPAAEVKPEPTPVGGGVLHKIVFASNRYGGRCYQLYSMEGDGSQMERLTNSDAFDRDPHVSYDGKTIAFSSNRRGNYFQIYALDLETRAVRQLTDSPSDKTNPFWSPDNREILFTVHDQGVNRLALMSADGTHERELTRRNIQSHGYGFSPDGRCVSYMDQDSQLLIMDLKSEKSTRFLKTDALDYRGNPEFSPLGSQIVFTSDVLTHRLRQIYIFEINSGRYYPLTRDNLDKDDPIFSPDGTQIAYVAKWENAWNIFVMDSDGKNVRNLTQSGFDHLVPSWR